jgi:single-strand DNA-binding protein
MAGSFNKVLLMGNLTRDIELRHTASNKAVARIGLAVNQRYTTSEGEKREETTFVDCEAWGRTAEVMSQYLGKGRPVLIEGRLKLDQWQDKESGQNRSRLVVVVENFQFVDSRGEGGDAPRPASGPAGASGGAPRAAGGNASRGGAAPKSQPGPSEGQYIDPNDVPF